MTTSKVKRYFDKFFFRKTTTKKYTDAKFDWIENKSGNCSLLKNFIKYFMTIKSWLLVHSIGIMCDM